MGGMPVHPQMVHFPVAFLSGACGFYMLYAWFGGERFRWTAWYCHILGLATMLPALITGIAARAQVQGVAPGWLDRHQTMGIGTGVYFLLLWVIFLQRPNWMRRRGMVTLLGIIGIALVWVTSVYGNTIVWRWLCD